MKIKLDNHRMSSVEDKRAASLIAEGFRRLRAQRQTALDGAKSKSCEAGCADSASVNVGNHESASQGFDK